MSGGQSRLFRLFTEGLAVIVSILIAFGLDAWWDERERDQVIMEDLASLENEISQNLTELRATREVQERIVSGTDALVEYLEAAGGSSVMVPDTLVWWALFNNPTFDPSFGGIDAFIASGRLAGVQDPSLRLEIAKVRGRIGDVIEEEVVARTMGLEQIYPLLASSGFDLDSIRDIIDGGYVVRPNQGTNLRDVPGFGEIAFPNSEELRFLLSARALWYAASNGEFGGVEQALGRALEMMGTYQAD